MLGRLRSGAIPATGIWQLDSWKIHFKFPDDFTANGGASSRVGSIVCPAGGQIHIDDGITEIYAEGVAMGHAAGDVKKQLYANLTSGFLPFQNGFNTKDGIVLKGNNVTFDSYDSRDGPYGTGNINSEVTVSTISVEVDAIDIGNADVYGYVATGANMPDVDPKGSITDYANPGVVDNSRITLDYYANFPNIDPPTLTSP